MPTKQSPESCGRVCGYAAVRSDKQKLFHSQRRHAFADVCFQAGGCFAEEFGGGDRRRMLVELIDLHPVLVPGLQHVRNLAHLANHFGRDIVVQNFLAEWNVFAFLEERFQYVRRHRVDNIAGNFFHIPE